MRRIKTLILLLIIGLAACKNKEEPVQACSPEGLLDSFTTQDGIEVFIYENGDLYTIKEGSCIFELQYFNPAQLENSYQIDVNDTFLVAGSDLFPVKNNYVEDFESATAFTDLFVASIADTHLFWTHFTLQSPLVPEVEDYIALRNCILDGSCTFKDNKIELAPDPINANNQTFKFTSVAPTANMITAKASITSEINYFTQGSDVWFQADYYIESGMPFSLVDFESGFFDQSPGPRVVLRGGKLEIENKFGTKINYENTTSTKMPTNKWFTLKVHLKYSSNEDGVIEMWQNGEQLISTTGISFPFSNAIIDRLEVGISSTPEGCVMYVDNIRISETAF
ncbi:hypothetical protein MNBD_BACTEROID06-1316 [hydrothermal vent metagenome]|uniref:Uncharacterized protein n=1 Tax=hydrothermal vent metagenome TaxID=652676 RepID=A0A3B0UIG7_9ZZZZ